MEVRAIYVMWLREVKRFTRSRSRIVGSLTQPLLFLVALGYGLGPIFRRAGQGDYFAFIVPGVISMSILFVSLFNGMQIIWDRQFGFLKETLVAPVSRLAIMGGRALGGATVAMMQGTLVLGITMLAGFRPVSLTGMVLGLLVMFLTALLFSGLGLVVASRLRDMQGFQLLINFLGMPVFFLSGALFPIAHRSEGLGLIARFDPLSYSVDALRIFLLGRGVFGLALDFTVLGGVTVAIFMLGAHFFSRMEI